MCWEACVERERSYRYSGTVINEHISHGSDAGRPDVMLLVRQSTVVLKDDNRSYRPRARSDYGKAEYIPWERKLNRGLFNIYRTRGSTTFQGGSKYDMKGRSPHSYQLASLLQPCDQDCLISHLSVSCYYYSFLWLSPQMSREMHVFTRSAWEPRCSTTDSNTTDLRL